MQGSRLINRRAVPITKRIILKPSAQPQALLSRECTMLATSYDSFIVIVSVLVAMLASFTALDMAGRVVHSTGKVALVWLFGGGFSMGIGIWAMHFIGMLSMNMEMVMSYNAGLTAFSAAIAVCASIFALWLVCNGDLPLPRLAGGALILGSGVVAMHYTGMAALMFSPVSSGNGAGWRCR